MNAVAAAVGALLGIAPAMAAQAPGPQELEEVPVPAFPPFEDQRPIGHAWLEGRLSRINPSPR